MLRLRLGEHHGDPNYKVFAEKLDELRRHMEENLITSIDFLRGLLTLAKEVLDKEKTQINLLTRGNKLKLLLRSCLNQLKLRIHLSL